MPYKYLLFILTCISLASCKESADQLIRAGIRLKDNGDDLAAIAKFREATERNSKLQIAYYDQAICHSNLKEYRKALDDLNEILAQQGSGAVELIKNPDGPFATEEDKAYVPRMTVLFERAMVEYSMDSLKSSFYDFRICAENDYEKKDSYLWMGTIYLRLGEKTKGCELYKRANPFGNNTEAIRLIKDNCN